MIRCDKGDVPTIVQSWIYVYPAMFEVTLFNGKTLRFDVYAARDFSCLGYDNWDAETDAMAVDRYVDCIWPMFTKPVV